eukprot:13641107-Alexandrium_andersonii.AAC.1
MLLLLLASVRTLWSDRGRPPHVAMEAPFGRRAWRPAAPAAPAAHFFHAVMPANQLKMAFAMPSEARSNVLELFVLA